MIGYTVTSTKNKPVSNSLTKNMLYKIPIRKDYYTQMHTNACFRDQMAENQCIFWRNEANFSTSDEKHVILASANLAIVKSNKNNSYVDHWKQYLSYLKNSNFENSYIKTCLVSTYLWDDTIPSIFSNRNPLIIKKVNAKILDYKETGEYENIFSLYDAFKTYHTNQNSVDFLKNVLELTDDDFKFIAPVYTVPDVFIRSYSNLVSIISFFILTILRDSQLYFMPNTKEERTKYLCEYVSEDRLQLIMMEDEDENEELDNSDTTLVHTEQFALTMMNSIRNSLLIGNVDDF